MAILHAFILQAWAEEVANARGIVLSTAAAAALTLTAVYINGSLKESHHHHHHATAVRVYDGILLSPHTLSSRRADSHASKQASIPVSAEAVVASGPPLQFHEAALWELSATSEKKIKYGTTPYRKIETVRIYIISTQTVFIISNRVVSFLMSNLEDSMFTL